MSIEPINSVMSLQQQSVTPAPKPANTSVDVTELRSSVDSAAPALEDIAVVDVPANAPRVANIYKVAVPAVEGLQSKHAIYLVAEGAEIETPMRPQWGPRRGPQRPQGLFDLHGFSKAGEKFEAPVVPQVTIDLNGTKLIIPDTPIRFTNQNGYTDQTRYQVYGKMEKDGNTIKCSANVPGVTFKIGSIVDGRCTIKATYNGLTKVYLIN